MDGFFWRSIVHSTKFRQIHVSFTIMAADNHVPQFPEGECKDDFGQTIAEIDIVLFLREGARIGAPLHTPLTSQHLNYASLHFIK